MRQQIDSLEEGIVPYDSKRDIPRGSVPGGSHNPYGFLDTPIGPQSSIELPRDMEVALSNKDLAKMACARFYTHDIHTEAATLFTASKIQELSDSITQFVSDTDNKEIDHKASSERFFA